MKFLRKPKIVDAKQYEKDWPIEFVNAIQFNGGRARLSNGTVWIYTPGGEWIIEPGEYAVLEADGYHRIWAAALFEQEYESVDAASDRIADSMRASIMKLFSIDKGVGAKPPKGDE